MLSSDLRRFARHLPLLVLAAVLAELAGTVVSPLVPQLLPGDAASSQIIERVVYGIVGTVVAGAMLSMWFGGRPLWVPEWVAALAAMTSSLLIGPWIIGLVPALRAPAVPVTPLVSVEDLAWMAGVILVLAPAELWIWRSASSTRVRAVYRSLWQATRGRRADDPDLVRLVNRGLARLRRQATSETAGLVSALEAWFDRWLASPDGISPQAAGPLIDGVTIEMTRLFGAPTTGGDAP